MDKKIKEGNKYNLVSGNYYWGKIQFIDRAKGEVKVLRVDYASITFGLYELQAWINEGILIKID